MENQEKLAQDREQAWLERKELDYRAAVEAAESLYQLSENRDRDEAKIGNCCDAINGQFGSFQGKLLEQERKEFFATLPVLNKLAKVYENFSSDESGEYVHVPPEVREVSRKARFVLSQGFLDIDENTLVQLDVDEAKAEHLFESLKLLLTSEYDFAIENAVHFLQTHKSFFGRLGEEKQAPGIMHRAEELENFLSTREFERALIGAIQQGIEARKSPRQMRADIPYGRDLLKAVLQKYGFDPEEILGTWQGSYTTYGPEPQIRRNMDKVFSLEDQRQGISRFLYKEFGIRNFERYPESLVVAEYDEFEGGENPYGILLEATHDWNGAFSAWSQGEILERLFEQIGERYALRIAEAKSKQDIARLLIRLKRKYGDHHKISFAFIGGHGSESSILFGGPYRRNTLFLEDLTGKGVARTGDFFEPHPTIVLVSCSTGAEGGIGQELSRVLGAKVIAPQVPTNLKNINAALTEDGIDFDIEYDKTPTAGSDQESAGVYSRGEKAERVVN
jgi:hypothetical protein